MADRQLASDPWTPWRERLESGEPVRVRAASSRPGLVRLALDGVHGRIIARDLLPDQRARAKELVGAELRGLVIAVEPEGRGVIVSPRRLAAAELGPRLGARRRIGGRVVADGSSGLIVEVGEGIRGFAPRSELRRRDARRPGLLVGRPWRGYLIELTSRRIVLSALGPDRRRLLARRRKRYLDRLEVGSIVSGRVRTVADYGAVIRLHRSGVIGIAFRNELSWWRLSRTADAVREGERLRLRVLDIRPPRGRHRRPGVTLSLRATQPNPWPALAEQLRPGTIVEGTVEKVKEYGAFVRLTDHPRVDGLSQFTGGGEPSAEPSARVPAVGDRVRAAVHLIDTARGRLELGELEPVTGDGG